MYPVHGVLSFFLYNSTQTYCLHWINTEGHAHLTQLSKNVCGEQLDVFNGGKFAEPWQPKPSNYLQATVDIINNVSFSIHLQFDSTEVSFFFSATTGGGCFFYFLS